MNLKKFHLFVLFFVPFLLFLITISTPSVAAQVESNVGIYWDQGCTLNPVTEIDWASLNLTENPFGLFDKVVYISNTIGVPITLSLDTEDWDPQTAENLIHLTWNYDADQSLKVDDCIPVTLTLSVAPSIKDSGITTFSFNTIIIGTEVTIPTTTTSTTTTGPTTTTSTTTTGPTTTTSIPTKKTLAIETMIYKYYPNRPLSGISIQFCHGNDCQSVNTNNDGIAIIENLIEGEEYSIIIPGTINSRFFSHFWDHDCDRINEEYSWQTTGDYNQGSYSYTFTMSNRGRKITLFYKISTKIVYFIYYDSTISGKLLDEDYDKIIETVNYYSECKDANTYKIIHPNRNVEFYYYDNGWNYIGSADSSTSDGSFSFSWDCLLQQTNIQARYTPVVQNLFYVSSNAEREYPSKISTKIEGLKFTNLQLTGKLLDEFNQPIKGKVNIDYQDYKDVWAPLGIVKSANDGSFSYNVNVNEIKRRFRVSYTPENNNYNPTSNTLIVGDFNNDKKCDIVDISLVAKEFECNKVIIDNFEDKDYTKNPPWSIDCGGNAVAEILTESNSNHALKITSTGGDGLACARTDYNAITGREITYACYGSRCQMCVWDGSKCINNPILCGYNLGSWTICRTTVTETKPNTNIYIYNDNVVNHWSVYDSIKEEIWTRPTVECDQMNCPKVDITGDGDINIVDIALAAKNYGIED